MKKDGKRQLFIGITSVVAFIVWTVLIQAVDVQPMGQNGTDIGFATWNIGFHDLTGVHMGIYILTDWLGLIPLLICMLFAGMGFVQLIKRRSLFQVDYDIILLGIYYVIVILCYLLFERFPVNYRPILIDGVMEASYPSSTTLLVLCVMPTITFQVKRRLKNAVVAKRIGVLVRIFSWSMVIGRLISGVHWFTDIVGSVMLSVGLFCVYKAAVSLRDKKIKSEAGYGIS